MVVEVVIPIVIKDISGVECIPTVFVPVLALGATLAITVASTLSSFNVYCVHDGSV